MVVYARPIVQGVFERATDGRSVVDKAVTLIPQHVLVWRVERRNRNT